jgi:outer membrane biosynthesis protein TonB
MLGITEHPLKRIVYGVNAVILVLLCTLVLAASAHAESGSEGPLAGQSSEQSAPVGSGAEEAAATTPPPAEEKKAEAAPTTPVVVETPEVPVTVPAVVETPEPAPTVPVVVETPEAKTTAPVAGETPDAKTTGTGGEEGLEGAQTPRAGSAVSLSTPSATQDGLVHAEVVQEVPTAVLVTTPESSGLGGLGAGIPPTSGPGGRAPRPPAAMTAARRVAEMSCALSALDGRSTDSCTAGLLGTQRVLSDTSTSFADAPLSLAAVAGPPAGGGHGGGTPGGSTPVSPGPGPAPGGAAGGSAAGTSGLALAGFLTLAGLLLLGAPRAMRRLRLSCEPWLTACFVLIPERPG